MADVFDQVEARRSRLPTWLSEARYDAVTALISSWFVLGVYVDVWAHSRRLPESFFTPWHLLLYSGFTATAWWLMLATVWMPDRRDRLALIGIAIFVSAGIADLGWHAVRGIEAGLAVPVSPPHLLLAVGGGLMVTSPIRHALSRSDELPVPLALVVSVGIATAAAGFPALQLNVFGQRWNLTERIEVAQHLADLDTGVQLDFYRFGTVLPVVFGSTLLAVCPLLFLVRRFGHRRWMATVLYTTFAGVSSVGVGVEAPAVLAGAVAAGLLTDLAIEVLPRRQMLLALSAIAPPLLWSCVYAGVAATGWLHGGNLEILAGTAALSTVALVVLTCMTGTGAEAPVDR